MNLLARIRATAWQRDPLVLRFEAPPHHRIDEHGFFKDASLAETGGNRAPGARWAGRLARLTAERLSLARILRSYQRTVAQPTLRGFDIVDVPFPHVVLLLPKGSAFALQEEQGMADALADRASSDMAKAWDKRVDPMVGCRVRAYVCDAVSTGCIAFLGEGVFAPAPDDIPVGSVTVFNASGQGFALRLPDEQPGAFYRGQSRLAFSGDPQRTPLHCAALHDIPGVFSIGCSRGAKDEPLLILLPHTIGTDQVEQPGIDRVDMRDVEDPFLDAVFKVVAPEDILIVLQVEICLDDRPSRLFTRQPAELSFAIRGLIEPPKAERWWFDLDRLSEGMLCWSAMMPARRSVVCHRKREEIEIWDWAQPREYRRRRGFSLVEIDLQGAKHRVVESAASLGWLRPPERSTPITLAPNAPRKDFALDWLDYAGAAEFRDGTVMRWAECWDTGRLPSVDHEQMPGHASSDSGPSVWFASAAHEPFSWGPAPDLRPGLRFLVAGLVLECVEGAAGTS